MPLSLDLSSRYRGAKHAAPWARVAVWCVALCAFAALRWWARLEPLNSDDMVLFETARNAAAGRHWLLLDALHTATPSDPLCLSCADGGLSHQALRIGLLPVALLVFSVLGPTLDAYHAVALLFQLLGAVAVWLLIRRHAGEGWAWIGFCMLAIMPYELAHASLFLVDLPAAACLLWALWAIDAPGLGSEKRRGLVAGLWLAWAYFLRENAPVLLLPSVLFLLRSRELRRTLVYALGILTLCYLLEQLLFVIRGLGFGYRASMVARAVDTFAPYLPVYDLGSFLHREFSSLWSRFGEWPLGAVAVLWLIGSLAAQAWLVLRSQNVALRAAAALGLTTFVIFAYAPHSISGLQVRALAPPEPRYLQPYFYAGLICVIVVIQRALVSGQKWELEAPPESGWKWRKPRALAACLMGLLAVSWIAGVARLERLQSRTAPLTRVLSDLERAVRTFSPDPEVPIWGPPLETRVLALVSAARGSPLRFRQADLSDLREQLSRDPGIWILRDVPREVTARRYLPPEEQQQRVRSARALGETLSRSHGRLDLRGRSLFVPRPR